MDACAIFTQVKEPHYYLFVKSGYTKDVQKQAAVDGVKLLMIDDLFSIEQWEGGSDDERLWLPAGRKQFG